MQKSAEIFLEPGTRIPNWLVQQTRYVRRASASVNGRRGVPVVTLYDGSEARFFHGGRVGVKTPSMPTFKGVFEEGTVLGIANLATGEMKWNNHFCERCSTLTGVEVARRDIPNRRGKSDIGFQCTRCRRTYARESI